VSLKSRCRGCGDFAKFESAPCSAYSIAVTPTLSVRRPERLICVARSSGRRQVCWALVGWYQALPSSKSGRQRKSAGLLRVGGAQRDRN